MPSRWICAIIVAAWLLLNGWLFYADLLPQLLPGQAPRLVIDLTDEARAQHVPHTWTVYQNGQHAFTMRTNVDHPRRDEFDFTATFAPATRTDRRATLSQAVASVGTANLKWNAIGLALAPLSLDAGPGVRQESAVALANGLRVRKMVSSYRVDTEGHLLGLDFHVEGTHEAVAPFIEGDFRVRVAGDIENGLLSPTLTLDAEAAKGGRTVPLTGIKVGRRGWVVFPLHPARRLSNVNRGQKWTAVVVEPLSEFLVAIQGLTDEPPRVRAAVRPETVPLGWGRWKEEPCLVIDYEGDRVKVSTWVRARDGMVLGQKATLGKTEWAMYRQ